MPVFQYVALDSQGVEIKDEIEALSEKEAISKIRNMGYFPTKVRSKTATKQVGKTAAKTRARRGARAKVKVKYVTEFARQLSTLQDAGLPILRSLRILEEQQKSGAFKRIIGYVADEIEGGTTLSEAMAKFPRCFDRLFVNMVAAGEAGGVLDLILARIADFKEKAIRLKGRVKSAMIYPIVVLTAAFLILLGLMMFVIPQFESVLKEMVGGSLNPITTAVLGISAWIAYRYGWAWMIATPIAIIITLRIIRRFQAGRMVLDSINLRMPVVGQLSSKVSITRWTRTLGTLISAGVPILDAINVTRETAGNEVYAKLLGNIHNSIRQGDTFAAPLRQSKTIDLLVSNMVAVGEETGDLDKMLLKVADNYDEQVDVLVGGLMSMLEPIMIIGLGGMVGVIVVAVFLPMIQVITSLSATGS
ncbi:MAG: type II secretion system F family protein [Sedimentisphaerales bacterium]|nr:type II secretion system F family protein [Sedimentisphaerales bacterium]NLZ04996.1 type II secretion system F family protein [Phycisphaerae bacterium]HNY77929.1 type II secretion system F family protein [Sedimentisphaerales bacterium]HOC63325.1 type II secretion system F family protein [Sedimentisphaerales bacterium]HOH64145.1 type II secretion system F family protein [Sedimentisphaerales bacterium]